MRIGAHVPTRGGLFGAIDSARECGAEAAQIWGSNPRAWAPPSVRADVARDFGRRWRSEGLGPLVLHAPYMVNVASPNGEFRHRSVGLAKATMALAETIGAMGIVVHAGAAGAATGRAAAVRSAAVSLRAIADAARRTSVFVELMAGGAGTVASTFQDFRELLDACRRHPRLALCADTCHLFAAGYDLHTESGVGACFDQIRELRLTGRLRLIHANDSRFPLGARRDSHTHIGEGHIGTEALRRLAQHPKLRHAAFILETPYDDPRADLKNLEALRSFVNGK